VRLAALSEIDPRRTVTSSKGEAMVTEKSARPRRRRFMIASVLALVVGLFALGVGGAAGANSQAGQRPRPTIVLVHGDWADGSSWTTRPRATPT
jgi:hypothetical protein